MATFLDNDVYAKFKAGNDLAAMADQFHAQLDAANPPPVPADQADRAGTLPDLTTGVAAPSQQPASPPAEQSSPPPPSVPPAVSDFPENPVLATPTALQQQTPPHGVVDVARTAVGSKYVWGGPGGRTDFAPSFVGSDCSGFVSWAMHQVGVDLPAQTASAYSKTAPLKQSDAQPGDVIFFNMGQGDPHQQHIAIYAGNGMMIHDSSVNPNGGVQLTPIWSGAEFRRPIGASSATANTQAANQVADKVSDATGGVSQPSSNPLEKMANDFHKKLDDLGSAAGQTKDTAGASLQKMADAFHQKLNDAASSAVGRVTEGLDPNAPGNQAIANAAQRGLENIQNQSPVDLTKPGAAAAMTGMDPAGQVIGGVTQAVQGAQAGDAGLGGVLGGALNVAGGVASVIPGEGGAVKAGLDTLRSDAVQAALHSRQAAEGLNPANEALNAAQAAVDALRARFPQMSEGSLAASGAGKRLAAAQEAAGAPPAWVTEANVQRTINGARPLEPGDFGGTFPRNPPWEVSSDVRPTTGGAAMLEPRQPETPAVASPATAAPEPNANPFQLETEPGPGRTPLTPEQAVTHFEDLTARYQANDSRISQLEDQLAGGDLTKSTGVVRPPGTTGWTDAEVQAYAKQNGLSAYSTQGWGSMAGDAQHVAAHKPNVPNVAKQSPKAARAELAQLRAENEQIATAAEHAIDNGGSQLYKNEPAAPADLPWDYNAPSDTAPASTAGKNAAGTAPRGSAPDSGTPPPSARAQTPARARGTPAQPQLTAKTAPLPANTTTVPAPAAPPPATWNASGVQLTGKGAAPTMPQANPPLAVGPQGTFVPGNQNIPGKQGGAVPPIGAPPGGKPPSKIITANAGPPPGPPPAAPVYARSTMTPDLVQLAHERIDKAIDTADPRNWAAHQQLDQMLVRGDDSGALVRFLAGEVEGKKVGIGGVVRTERTGSMAGGALDPEGLQKGDIAGTEIKVVAGPIIQTAMRAPMGAINALRKGRPGDIGKGLQGVFGNMGEPVQEALQTLRWGVNDRAALSGGASGGYGGTPGLDVMGKNPVTRAIGAGLTGLVRTHGAIADISAGIGRNAALGQGAAPEAAAEIGQQWALRSGNYGVTGQLISDGLSRLRQVNPALDVVGQILIPFFRVGYNAFTQGVEHSPLGLAGRITDKLGGKAFNSDKLANNLFGVGLAGLGLAAASGGNLTGERPQGGNPKWSVRVGGAWVPLRTLGPAGEALAQSATLYEAARDGRGDVAKTAELTAETYVGHVTDDTWLRSVGDVFTELGAVKSMASGSAGRSASAAKEWQYQAGRQLQSFVPQYALGRQAVQAVQAVRSRTAPSPVNSVPAPSGSTRGTSGSKRSP